MKNTALKRCASIICAVFFALIVTLYSVLLIPELFGMHFINSTESVLGIERGSLVCVRAVAVQNVCAGDIICYTYYENQTIFARVEGIDAQNGVFVTATENGRGKPAAFDRIVGVVRFSLPDLGFLRRSIDDITARAIIILITIVLGAAAAAAYLPAASRTGPGRRKAPAAVLLPAHPTIRSCDHLPLSQDDELKEEFVRTPFTSAARKPPETAAPEVLKADEEKKDDKKRLFAGRHFKE